MLRGYIFRSGGRDVDIPLRYRVPKTIAAAERLAMWASRSGLALALSHSTHGIMWPEREEPPNGGHAMGLPHEPPSAMPSVMRPRRGRLNPRLRP